MTGPARTRPEPLVVPDTDLGPRQKLSQGANGVIHLLTAYRLPEAAGELVFKEYRGSATVSPAALRGIVGARAGLPPGPTRTTIDTMTVWPLRIVVDSARHATGVLMRLIPAEFLEDMRLPSGRTKRVAREAQHLIVEPGVPRRFGIAVPRDGDLVARVEVCQQLAHVLAALERAGLVFGDLSARNVLYRLAPSPSVLLVDCDAARRHGNAAVHRQVETVDWDAPPRTNGRPAAQTHETDRYKLALFILRCLTPGRGSSVNRDWRRAAPLLEPKGRELMQRAFGDPPEERPTAEEWDLYLTARLGRGTMPQLRRPPAWRRGPHGKWTRA